MLYLLPLAVDSAPPATWCKTLLHPAKTAPFVGNSVGSKTIPDIQLLLLECTLESRASRGVQPFRGPAEWRAGSTPQSPSDH